MSLSGIPLKLRDKIWPDNTNLEVDDYVWIEFKAMEIDETWKKEVERGGYDWGKP